MPTITSSNDEPSESWRGEKFSELRTLPAQWDLSELTSPAKPSQNSHSPSTARAALEPSSPEEPAFGEPEKHEIVEASPEWQRFPEPKTFPSGWDLAW